MQRNWTTSRLFSCTNNLCSIHCTDSRSRPSLRSRQASRTSSSTAVDFTAPYKTSATDLHTLLGPRRRVPSSLPSLSPHDTASSGSRYLRRRAEQCVYLFMASNTSASLTFSHARDVPGSRKRTRTSPCVHTPRSPPPTQSRRFSGTGNKVVLRPELRTFNLECDGWRSALTSNGLHPNKLITRLPKT